MCRIALLVPYYSSSHKKWADGLLKNSSHEITLFTLPGRFWKWRMHGGAVTFARQFHSTGGNFDLILTTDMLDVTTFLALTRTQTAHLPVAIYFHENQLTYPPPPGTKRDLHYGFINYASMLSSDKIFFNSAFHLDSLMEELPRMLKHFPDYNELSSLNAIRQKSSVLSLGMDLSRLDEYRLQSRGSGPLRILWNHRWEYDKQPAVFLDALYHLQRDEIPFEVIILGQSFRQQPEEFLEAKKRLSDHILHFGYVESFDDYAKWLWAADIQVSCAIQDFFGGSTCEAVYADCVPILPDRLNYPVFVPNEFKDVCLYNSKADLINKLRWSAMHVNEVRQITLRRHVAKYDWAHMIQQYDQTFNDLVTTN